MTTEQDEGPTLPGDDGTYAGTGADSGAAEEIVGGPLFWDDELAEEHHALVPDMWFTAALEEYRSLRIEIVDAIGAQRRIMQLGVAGETVLVGFGLQPIDPVAAVALLGLIVPVVGLFVTAGAMGELTRAVRASAFLLRREVEIDRMVGVRRPPAMAWERWLRRMPRVSLRDYAEFAVLFVVVIGAIVIATFRSTTSSLWTGPAQPYLIGGGVVAGLFLIASPTLLMYQLRRAGSLFKNERGRSWQHPSGPTVG